MELLLGFGGSCLVLLILALVLREVTEQRLGRFRAELMQLRSQVRLLEDRMKTYRSIRSQVREVLQRIDSRKMSANDSIENIYDKLSILHLLLRDEELPESERDEAELEAAEQEAEEVGA
jgi:chromosome segregation ATPase